MTDASTATTRASTYTQAGVDARTSAIRFDDHAQTARGEASKVEGLPHMSATRDELLGEARRADASAEDRRGLAKGFDSLASLEGRD